ncbi:MAG: hypothetical protein GY798_16475 [Hyphomicrobiales bacterium]|nr:hypothetical protein [Hyphomicrobiales bacterium]
MRRLSRPLRLVVTALMIAVLFAVVVAGAVLLSGPTDVGFLRDRLARELEERLGPGHAVAVERAAVRIDGELGFIVEIGHIAVVDAFGTVVATVPATQIVVDPFGLLVGNVTIRSIAVLSPQISLVRTTNGDVHLGDLQSPDPDASDMPVVEAESRPRPDGGFPALADLLHSTDRLLSVSEEQAIAIGLSDAAITGATIRVWDRASQRQKQFAATDIHIAVAPESHAFTVDISTAGKAGRWTASLARMKDTNIGHRVTAGFSQVALADLFVELSGDPSSDLPLFGDAAFGFTDEGALNSAALRLDVGAGFVSIGESNEPVLLDEATLGVRWDLEERQMVIEPSSVHVGRTTGTMSGWIRPADETGEPRFSFALESRDAVLSARDNEALPVQVDRLALVGSVDLAEELLEIGDLSIQTEQGSLALRGTIGFSGSTPSLALAASVSPMPIATFKQLWVPFIAPGARRWVMANITDGRIVSGEFEASVPAGLLGGEPRLPMPGDALRLNLRLEDVVFQTIGRLPPVSEVSANVVLAGATLGVDIESARVDVRSSGIVAVEAGAFAIDDVFDPMPVGAVEVRLSGSAQALGAVANSEPLRVLSRRGMDPRDLTGVASAAISLRLPLEKEVHELADAMDWKVVVTGNGLGSAKPVEGRVFSDADVTISVTREAVVASGTAVIDGVRADVSMRQRLGGDGDVVGPGQQLARLALDEAARRKLGLDLEDVLEGTVGAQISGLADGEGQHYDLDLKPVRLTIPGLGWTKGMGVPATLSFDLLPVENGHMLENIVMAGDGFGLSGTAHITGEDGLVAADIEDFALRPGDSLSFRLTATETGYAIAVNGGSFDARGLITDAMGTDMGGTSPDLSITAQIDRVTGFNEGILEDLRGRFLSVGGVPTEVTIDATLATLPISVAYRETPSGASLRAAAQDAGQVLRFLDVYSRVGGGGLDLIADRQGSVGPLAGRLTLDNFVILDEPAVGQVIASGSVPPAIDPSRLHFDHMVAQFGLSTDAIVIDDAVLRGQAVGATFSGRVDLKRSQVGINGTYLPVYAVNSVFSRVPVIGRVLGGGNGEGGLIGVTFRVEGPVEQPRVFINPLSAVAPGIFRKIFEFR